MIEADHGLRVVSGDPSRDSQAIEELLHHAYVDSGFTDASVAESVFAASSVFARGRVFVILDGGALVGMTILVPPGAPGRKLAEADHAELQLLAVHASQRKRGLGTLLVKRVQSEARHSGVSRLILWTQPRMQDAQRLYLREGFARTPERDFHHGTRSFLVFECDLSKKSLD
jgi:GNAT superfamily N-acetyltransferase